MNSTERQKASNERKRKKRCEKNKKYYENKSTESNNKTHTGKWAAYKRQQRQGRKQETVNTENRKQTWAEYKRRQRQKKREKQRECASREREKKRKYRAQIRERVQIAQTVPDTKYVFPNRTAKFRAKQKVEAALPYTPERRTALLNSFTETTDNRKVQRSLSFEDNPVISDIREAVQHLKCQRSGDSRAALNVITASVFGQKTLKSKSSTNLVKQLGLSKRRISGGKRIRNTVLKSDESCWTSTKRKTRSDRLSEENKKTVFEFWQSPGISRPACNKNDVKRVRLSRNVYSSHMTHILEKTQTECYTEFKQKHPSIKISQRLFERCRPYFVVPAREKHRNTCCCRYHTEIRYVMESCMKFRNSIRTDWSDEEKKQYPVYGHLTDLVESTLCPKQNGNQHFQKKCLDRCCSDCGIHKFHIHDRELSNDGTSPSVKWTKYEYVILDVKGKQIKKLMMVQKQTTPGEMFQYLQTILGPFPSHAFLATLQNDQLKALIQALPQKHCIAIHAFSENYTCSEKDEIQSNYFSRTECSLHVTILYRHANLDTDGEQSTEEEPKVISEQLFVISPDLKHDNFYTKEVQQIVADHLKSTGCDITHMHEFTDGCSSQYKSKTCMGDLSNADLGYTALYRNYYETSHAKGQQDAAGGLVKHMADMAVIRGTAVIQNAKMFHDFGNERLSTTRSQCKRRIFRYLEQINRTDEKNYRPVKNNRQLHQIVRNGEFGLLKIRELSCYSCENCLSACLARCENSDICGILKDQNMIEITGKDNVEANGNDTTFTPFRDLIGEGSVVAVFTDDEESDYYLTQVKEKPHKLARESSDDWGNTYPAGTDVIIGNYYDRTSSGKQVYKLVPRKSAIIPFLAVRYIVSEAGCFKKKLQLTEDTHMEILECIEQQTF